MPQQMQVDAGNGEEEEEAETKNINVPIPADEHERMRKIKDLHGDGWRDVLRRGIGTYDIPDFLEE